MKASTTLHPETILSCAERLRRHATKARPPLAADLRLAAAYCRRLASIAIFDQAAGEKDHARRWVGLGVIGDNIVNIGRAMERKFRP